MDFMFFHPGRADSLSMFFKDTDEKEYFLGSLSEDAREYIRNHAEEFETKEELEIAAAKFQDGCDEITETRWDVSE